MSFITNQFWICLYMQKVLKLKPLAIAIRLLPQTVAGIVWSYFGSWLAPKLDGALVMGIGAGAYLVGAGWVLFLHETTSYWKVLCPALLITVAGADFQFIVSNVRAFFLSFLLITDKQN